MIESGRSALLAGVIAAVSTSCSLIGSIENYRPDTEIELESVAAHVPAGQVDWLGFSLGGEAGEYRLARSTGELRVKSEQIAWDQFSFGPILPVIPVLMGASSTLVGIEVRITAIDEPQSLIPTSIQLVEAKHYDDSAPVDGVFAPVDCTRVRPGDSRWKWESLDMAEPVQLATGEALRLRYAPYVRTVEQFDILFPNVREDEPPLRLPFRYQCSSVFFFALIPFHSE